MRMLTRAILNKAKDGHLLSARSNRLSGGPWTGLTAPPSANGAWKSGSRLWVVRMHDDPLEVTPCFVEQSDRPFTNPPAVALGFYTYDGSGWHWTRFAIEESES